MAESRSTALETQSTSHTQVVRCESCERLLSSDGSAESAEKGQPKKTAIRRRRDDVQVSMFEAGDVASLVPQSQQRGDTASAIRAHACTLFCVCILATLLVFVGCIFGDVWKQLQMARDEKLQEIRQCKDDYELNQCDDPRDRLVEACNKLELCMNAEVHNKVQTLPEILRLFRTSIDNQLNEMSYIMLGFLAMFTVLSFWLLREIAKSYFKYRGQYQGANPLPEEKATVVKKNKRSSPKKIKAK